MGARRMRLYLGVLATVVGSATVSTGAWATTGGHFVMETEHAEIDATQSVSHGVEIVLHGSSEIVCNSVSLDGTTTNSTVTELLLTPSYSGCHTIGSESGVSINTNGCVYRFTVARGTEQTLDLVCPAGKAVEISHPNCLVKVPPQNNLGGVTYTTVTVDGKHANTVDWSIDINSNFESGICVFLGTNKTMTIEGTHLLRAYFWGVPISLTFG